MRTFCCTISLALALFSFARATSIPRLTFEQLTDTSDAIVAGNITRSWAAWDSDHKYIWTHYQLSVESTHKGVAAASVIFAEPGGTVDGFVMAIAGSVAYAPGQKVLIFLQKMPNGYLRTTGWGQGKYNLDQKGTLHGDSALRTVELIGANTPPAKSTSLTRLDGMDLNDVSARIASRVRTTASSARRN